MTKSIAVAEAKAAFSELASRASAGERFLVLRRGKPVAALVGPEDLELLEQATRRRSFLEALESFRARHRRSLPERPLAVRRSGGRRVP